MTYEYFIDLCINSIKIFAELPIKNIKYDSNKIEINELNLDNCCKFIIKRAKENKIQIQNK